VLQVQIALKSTDEYLRGCHQGIEGPGSEGDGRIKLEVHIDYAVLRGIRARRARGVKVCCRREMLEGVACLLA